MRIAQWIASKRHAVIPRPLSALIPVRDYTGLNEQNDELRLWVSEPVKRGLEEVIGQTGLSMTAYLTEFFATYLYGYHELLRMREMHLGLYAPVIQATREEGVTRSQSCDSDLSDESEINLGKNIFPLKIFVPTKLKADLTKRATKAGLTLGEFARALISTHLFGQVYAPRRKAGTKGGYEARANQWESEALPTGDIPF
jgi:hypothetical protein